VVRGGKTNMLLTTTASPVQDTAPGLARGGKAATALATSLPPMQETTSVLARGGKVATPSATTREMAPVVAGGGKASMPLTTVSPPTQMGLFCLRKDLSVSQPNLARMTKRRQSVLAPDQRPCFGCTWCGPPPRLAKGSSTLCPFCRLLEGHGWFLRDDKKAKKKIFINRAQQRQHTSVRDFLEGSTATVGQIMSTLSPEDHASLFAELYPIHGSMVAVRMAAVNKPSKPTQGTKRAASDSTSDVPPIPSSALSFHPHSLAPPLGANGDWKRPKRTPKPTARFETASNAAACSRGEGASCPGGNGVVAAPPGLDELHPGHPPATANPTGSALHGLPPPQAMGANGAWPAVEHGVCDAAQPAANFPAGWAVRWIPRPDGKRQDMCFFSPRHRFKFRSEPAARLFLSTLEDEGGNEAAAILLMKKKRAAPREADTIVSAPAVGSDGTSPLHINSGHPLPDKENPVVEGILDLLVDIHNARIHASLVEGGLRQLTNTA